MGDLDHEWEDVRRAIRKDWKELNGRLESAMVEMQEHMAPNGRVHQTFPLEPPEDTEYLNDQGMQFWHYATTVGLVGLLVSIILVAIQAYEAAITIAVLASGIALVAYLPLWRND